MLLRNKRAVRIDDFTQQIRKASTVKFDLRSGLAIHHGPINPWRTIRPGGQIELNPCLLRKLRAANRRKAIFRGQRQAIPHKRLHSTCRPPNMNDSTVLTFERCSSEILEESHIIGVCSQRSVTFEQLAHNTVQRWLLAQRIKRTTSNDSAREAHKTQHQGMNIFWHSLHFIALCPAGVTRAACSAALEPRTSKNTQSQQRHLKRAQLALRPFPKMDHSCAP